MKFGDQLRASCNPEWAQEYVDYVALKRLLHASRHVKRSYLNTDSTVAEVDQERAEFDAKWESQLSSELQKVNAFFSTQLQHLEQLTGMLAAHMHEAELNASVRKQLGRKLGRFLQQHHSLTEYSSLNFLAFFKICKKHDKILGGTMIESMSWVRDEPFFAPGRERLARVKVQLEALSDGIPIETIQLNSAMTVGSSVRIKALYFFMGCVIMGLFALVTLAHLPQPYKEYYFSHAHMGHMIDFWRFFLLGNLLVWLCGICTAVFERYGINYVFLFGINAGTCLPADWYFTLAAGQLLVLMLMMIIFLADFKFTDTCYEEHSRSFQRCDIYPIIVLVSSVVMPFLPSRHFRRKYRRNLMACFFSVVAAPFPAVTFAANIFGDILCSFTRPLKDLEFVACYTVRLLSGRTFPKKVKACYSISNDMVSPGRFILIIPFWFRLMQCLRRYISTGEKWPHLANLAKYICSLAVGLISITHLINAGMSEANANLTWGALAAVATVYSYLWDIYMDWGLELVSARRKLGEGHVDAEGKKLKAELYPRFVYRTAMLLNLVGRTVWSTNLTVVLPFWNFGYNKVAVETILSMVELLRRGMWMLIRVELEHLRHSARYPSLCYVPPERTSAVQQRLETRGNWAPSLPPTPKAASNLHQTGGQPLIRFDLPEISAASPDSLSAEEFAAKLHAISFEQVTESISPAATGALHKAHSSWSWDPDDGSESPRSPQSVKHAKTWSVHRDTEKRWGKGKKRERRKARVGSLNEICMVPLAAATSY